MKKVISVLILMVFLSSIAWAISEPNVRIVNCFLKINIHYPATIKVEAPVTNSFTGSGMAQVYPQESMITIFQNGKIVLRTKHPLSSGSTCSEASISLPFVLTMPKGNYIVSVNYNGAIQTKAVALFSDQTVSFNY